MTRLEKAEALKREDKFTVRSCWECNPAHEHLKTRSGLFTCCECGRWYMDGGFFDDDKHCAEEV